MRRATLVTLPLLLLLGCTSTSGPAEGDPAPPSTPPAQSGRWQPRPGVAWQWQLNGRLDTSVDVPVYDIDGFDQSKATVAALHAKNRKVICYLSTGAYEDWRPDAADFPRSVIGKGNGWEGERWLDIRQLDTLEPLMAKRLDMCKDKGFDAVEPDNMDGYRNDTGFPLKPDDQLRYNRLIARLSHDRGMSVGLKNDMDQIPSLLDDFDFAVNEQCAQYDECDTLTPFIDAGKAVFHVEYELPTSKFCEKSRELRLSSLEKRYELGAWRKAC
ncbi:MULTISPECIES: endo alpha-1,4 polygalactosaminidase [unclassified Streptomyces]|uniref:endo alpha-1,4 polygalactosaminidase n=1 Tax=unclassified Streptomyces TaxID=2593676 RepID=UPI000DD8E064|nr:MULTISPECIES: endo alpha-1,4 polygalactosaminidase [unclassified Streptomyces]QZZ27399.1 endo alpha-1,4 polygalactosaminidase [Streptomyces sp. ST1015]